VGDDAFLIARNPEEDSKLPYLLRLPIGGGLVLKARDTGRGPPVSTVIRSTRAGPPMRRSSKRPAFPPYAAAGP